jgi:2-oxoglutarate ferredoxin oxidoreductase subunit gamma
MAQIKIAGFGGQGIILAGIVIGRAAAIYEDKFATMTQSFGPEARGSSCHAELILSESRIHYPYVKTPDVLIVMSQDAYNKFEPQLNESGILIIESELVRPKRPRDKIKLYGIPATRFAEGLGRKLVANIVMLGFFTGVTGLLRAQAMRSAIKESVPKGTEELNLKAFEEGYNYEKRYLEL